MMELMQFGAGVVVGVLACYLVVRNQVAKHAELQAYVDALEVKARAYTDEVWDDVSEMKAKVAELAGRVSK